MLQLIERRDDEHHHPHHRFRHRQPLRGRDEGRDPVDQPGGDASSISPMRFRRKTSATRPWCWRKSPTGFPPGTIHVAVVDPGVGTDRAIVYARIGRQQFMAPDNGLLSRVMARMPPSKIIRLAEPRFWLRRHFHHLPRPRHHGAGGRPAEPGPGARQLGPPLERLIISGMAAGATAGPGRSTATSSRSIRSAT